MQLGKKFPEFYETQNFTIEFTRSASVYHMTDTSKPQPPFLFLEDLYYLKSSFHFFPKNAVCTSLRFRTCHVPSLAHT